MRDVFVFDHRTGAVLLNITTFLFVRHLDGGRWRTALSVLVSTVRSFAHRVPGSYLVVLSSFHTSHKQKPAIQRESPNTKAEC